MSRVVFSLRTASPAAAAKRASEVASRLDAHWFNLRIESDPAIRSFFRSSADRQIQIEEQTITHKKSVNYSLSLSQAIDLYLRLKGQNRPQTFYRGVDNASKLLIELCGDKNITAYDRTDANNFRDHLMSKNMAGTSIVRCIGNIKAIINFATAELGVPPNTSFSRLYIDRKSGTKERQPVSIKNIRKLQEICREWDDEKRWMIGLISDTGIRLGEAVGLVRKDFQVRDGIPVVIVQPHPWRRLKTANSERTVPLVGAAHWAMKRIIECKKNSEFAFPIYNKTGSSNSNSASAALNKWMNVQISNCGSVHGLRHSLRDRLRTVECPADVVDQLGGWLTHGVGHGYGDGYPLHVLHKWMSAIACDNDRE
jgi:integrase